LTCGSFGFEPKLARQRDRITTGFRRIETEGRSVCFRDESAKELRTAVAV
jgi:hypothetical protein